MELVVDFSKLESKKELWRVLKLLHLKPYKITIVEDRDSRTNRQNRFYWGTVVNTLAAHTGYTADEMHELIKTKFLGTDLCVQSTGEVIRIPRSTAILNTKEFGEFLEEVIAWAVTDMGCYIPHPGELIIQNS